MYSPGTSGSEYEPISFLYPGHLAPPIINSSPVESLSFPLSPSPFPLDQRPENLQNQINAKSSGLGVKPKTKPAVSQLILERRLLPKPVHLGHVHFDPPSEYWCIVVRLGK